MICNRGGRNPRCPQNIGLGIPSWCSSAAFSLSVSVCRPFCLPFAQIEVRTSPTHYLLPDPILAPCFPKLEHLESSRERKQPLRVNWGAWKIQIIPKPLLFAFGNIEHSVKEQGQEPLQKVGGLLPLSIRVLLMF